MRLRIISGQQGVDILEASKGYNDDIIAFPEIKICHPYDLCEHVMREIQEYYDKNMDLNIVTYSEVVLDAARLWVARNQFENAECINILSNENLIIVPIDKYGELEKWVEGVFDTKMIVLRELIAIKIKRRNE